MRVYPLLLLSMSVIRNVFTHSVFENPISDVLDMKYSATMIYALDVNVKSQSDDLCT